MTLYYFVNQFLVFNNMGTSIEIRPKKINKTYHEGDLVSGILVIDSKTEVRHDGLTITLEGNVTMQLSAKNVGIFDAFYSSVKPVQLVFYSVEVAKSGRFPPGRTEIPFEFPLKSLKNKILYESYHGVFINIHYGLKCEMKRPLLNKDMTKSLEFFIEYKDRSEQVSTVKPVNFTISPESLQNMSVKDRSKIPNFQITGKLDTTICCITQPFTGELCIKKCEAPIRSVELQLVRVETCGCAEGYARDATEIQNIQIGEGDVCHNLAIPIYMIFPRLFTCPTLITNNFKIEFEVNIVVVFEDDHIITENFPIKITRF